MKEIITERDWDGKPIAGRYPFGRQPFYKVMYRKFRRILREIYNSYIRKE